MIDQKNKSVNTVHNGDITKTKKGCKYAYSINEGIINDMKNDNCYMYGVYLCINSEYRNEGISSNLIMKLFSLLHKGTKMGLHVRYNNTFAQDLYFKFGFQHIDRVKRYYPEDGADGWEIALIIWHCVYSFIDCLYLLFIILWIKSTLSDVLRFMIRIH